ncbi:MAG: aminotransferase class I/II-fold pyridoxal phosphate-dependent enzyme [Puniceicoccales bacterium]|jgi:LL-diaminopimelate aminotransferase|nr:aminotransferase class I/II-fold pyridoxal phosphate-dependent enzyme [Puniceicoccales bacterium]
MDVSGQFAKKIFSERIGGKNFGNSNQIYKFEKIKRAKREALAKFPGRVLIDMGVGEPDDMAANSLIEALACEARKYENRGYADNGCQDFKEAVASYMKSQFNVSLDPQTEIIHSIGSKAALSILSLCFVNPGDVVLMTTPGYPIFGTHSRYLLADIIYLPLRAKNSYLPALDDIPKHILQKTKVIVVNYPNNPTGACATKEFFRKLVHLAHEYSFLIINDAAYASLTFHGENRLSIFNVDGAKKVSLELHSMSKGFNMTGWRLGWVCGNSQLMAAYAHVKDLTDSGQFLAIQKAAAKALQNNMSIPVENAQKYERRMNQIAPILKNCGFNIGNVRAGFFLYTQIPNSAEYNDQKIDFPSAEKFAEWMIADLGIVVVPWDDVEPSLRFSMTFGSKDMDENKVIDLFRSRMSDVRFNFGKSK